MVEKDIPYLVIDFLPISERVVLLKIAEQPINVNIIQTHAVTADKSKDEVVNFTKI